METVAENTTVVSKKLYYEASAAVDKSRGYAWKGVGILGLGWVVFALVTLLLKGSPAMALGELLVLAAVGVWLLWVFPRRKYSRGFKAMCDRNGGNMERRILFYEDCCVVEMWDSTVTIDYSQIEKTTRTKNALVITCFDKTGTMVSLDGFSKGDAQTVIHYINKEAEREE